MGIFSTHIQSAGHALFRTGRALSAEKFSSHPRAITDSWIRKTSGTAVALPSAVYIHRDIRIPYDTELTDEAVEQSLSECLGNNRPKYGLPGWHVFFQEDTSQGTQYRVFITLEKNADTAPSPADFRLPIETALFALARAVGEQSELQDFQYVLPWNGDIFSLIILGGSPFHFLRFTQHSPAAAAERLRVHAGFSGGEAGSMALILSDPGPELQEALEKSSCWKSIQSAKPFFPEACADAAALLHFGLARAAQNSELGRHNSADPGRIRRNTDLRDLSRLARASLAVAALCLVAAAGLGARIFFLNKDLARLEAQAGTFKIQIDHIENMRAVRKSLADSLEILKPLWHLPVSWHRVFESITDALPKESGIDGFVVENKEAGFTELRFRAWVKDWDLVNEFSKKLEGSPFLSSVSLSDQQMDERRGQVNFHVSSRVVRF